MPTILGSTARGRLRSLLAAGCLAIAVTGCSDVSFDAQTNTVYDPGVGSNARGGGVDVLNALIVDNGDGTGTISATLVLNPGSWDTLEPLSPVTLEAIEVTPLDGGQPVNSRLIEGGVTLEPNEPVRLGDEAVATVSGDQVTAGDMVTLTLTFDPGDQPAEMKEPVVELDIPVVERTEMYDQVAEAPPAS